MHDVVDRAGILDSQLARHAGRVPRIASCINTKNRPFMVFAALCVNIKN